MKKEILFFESNVKEVRNWIKNNRDLALFFGLILVFASAFNILFGPTLNPAWRSIPMLAVLYFMCGGGIFLATHYMIVGMRVAPPVLREDGFIFPWRDKIGDGSEQPEARENFLIPYSDIDTVLHRKQSKPKPLEYVMMIFLYQGKVRNLILLKGKQLHDIDKFIEILRNHNVKVISEPDFTHLTGGGKNDSGS
jgi:hypothetical protein